MLPILCIYSAGQKRLLIYFFKKRNQQVTGGPRLETENILRVIRGVVEIETYWVSCISTKRSGSSCSKPTLKWTKWQEIQSKSTWDDLRSWSCRGLPNKTMTLKQITNTIAADLDLVKFNLCELKKSIQLISLILL